MTAREPREVDCDRCQYREWHHPTRLGRSRNEYTVVVTRQRDGGRASVVVQPPAESFASSDRPVVVLRRQRRGQQLVIEALVVALEVIVLDEFSDGPPQVPLAEQHELVQSLALD